MYEIFQCVKCGVKIGDENSVPRIEQAMCDKCIKEELQDENIKESLN